jgi:hypothetical protein
MTDRNIIVIAAFFAFILMFSEAAGILTQSVSINSTGLISNSVPNEYEVTPFSIRIADMMTDLVNPNFDDRSSAMQWQAALDNLSAASPNGEITHVQMRVWWSLMIDNQGNPGDNFITPRLGSTDGIGNPWGTQWSIMMNDTWKRWYFGYIAPGQQPLPYGPGAIQRLRNKNFKLELAVSGAWGEGPTALAKPGGDTCNIGGWGAREANFPNWIAAGGGDQFLENYKNNVLLPVANFVKDYLQDGDIFSLSFEMSYPTADFTWSHNAKWNETINAVRDVFSAAGKHIILTLDHCGWYDDYGLGYDAVKLLNPSAPLGSSNKGMAGAKYLANLDFISFSNWLPLVLQSEMKTTWADTDVPNLVNHWFANPNFEKPGTGYSAVPAVEGRDIIADCRALAQVMGKLILQNTGWESSHGFLYHSPNRVSGATVDLMEQRVAWAAQLGAIADNRSQWQTWCAGQDFERYCEDKATNPTNLGASWRNAPAQEAIISGIRSILNQ